MIKTKVVRNGISNNLYPHEKLTILQSSPSESLQIWPNSQIWCDQRTEMEALEFGLIAVVGIKYCEFYIDEWLKEIIQWILISFCKKPNNYGLI